MSIASEKKERQENAVKKLREYCTPGTKVYTALKKVSSSGMSRHISLYVATLDAGKPAIQDITYLVARALDYRRDEKDGGLIVGGCGMDMGYHLVNSLSYCLHGMESKGKGQTGQVYREDINSENYHAGYSLQHEWL